LNLAKYDYSFKDTANISVSKA